LFIQIIEWRVKRHQDEAQLVNLASVGARGDIRELNHTRQRRKTVRTSLIRSLQIPAEITRRLYATIDLKFYPAQQATAFSRLDIRLYNGHRFHALQRPAQLYGLPSFAPKSEKVAATAPCAD